MKKDDVGCAGVVEEIPLRHGRLPPQKEEGVRNTVAAVHLRALHRRRSRHLPRRRLHPGETEAVKGTVGEDPTMTLMEIGVVREDPTMTLLGNDVEDGFLRTALAVVKNRKLEINREDGREEASPRRR